MNDMRNIPPVSGMVIGLALGYAIFGLNIPQMFLWGFIGVLVGIFLSLILDRL